jgi:hypothetical protein
VRGGADAFRGDSRAWSVSGGVSGDAASSGRVSILGTCLERRDGGFCAVCDTCGEGKEREVVAPKRPPCVGATSSTRSRPAGVWLRSG